MARRFPAQRRAAAETKQVDEASAVLFEVEGVLEEGDRNHPLSELQKDENRERSKIRARIEHVFGRWVMTMGGKKLRSIGLERAKTYLGLTHLTYNLKRFVFWQVNSVSMPEC